MFFERDTGGDRALLVHIEFPEGDDKEDPREFEELVLSAGANAIAVINGTRRARDPKTFVGKGKVDEIRAAVIEHEIDVVLFNHSLSPSQERNIERIVECRVLDRTGLILDIFAQRARTHEGKLQVELAQLNYQATRLVRGWTHLERQKGGIGLRGPGETQLETDRRLLRVRVNNLLSRLKKVEKQRDQGRRMRSRSATPTVSLVGYTNAGKSTLFNHMTDAEVYAANQLFATLDPTLRKMHVTDLGDVILADTVGFIRHLPHKLVDAFKATLQETIEADLILHVVDCASGDRIHQIEQVENVLAEIGADDVLRLEVYNKIDLLHNFEPIIERDTSGKPRRVWVSAITGQGKELLISAIAELLAQDIFDGKLELLPKDGQLRALLFEKKAVLNEEYLENGNIVLHVRMEMDAFKKALAQTGIPASRFIQPPEKEFFET
mgnify:CR=1 FL=1